MVGNLQDGLIVPREKLLFIINSFRVSIILILLCISFLPGSNGLPLVGGPGFYTWITSYVIIVLFSIFLSFAISSEKALYSYIITISSMLDIIMIVILMSISGGIQSGYGILLLPFLAMLSLPVSGRYAMFYAAFASICLFIGVILDILNGSRTDSSNLFQAGLLAITCFIVSLVTWQLGNVARRAAKLASARGNQIAHLSRLNALALQGLQEAVLIFSADGRVQQFNSKAKQYFPQLKHGSIIDSILPLLRKWRNQPRLPLVAEQQVNNIQLRGRLVPIWDAQEVVLVLFLRDMADIAEDSQKIKLAALGRLTANIAHEIRNPLSAINHAADLLTEQCTDPTDQRLARMICENAQRINRLVEEVLALNRRDRVRLEVFGLKDWLAEFLTEFRLVHPDIKKNNLILHAKDSPHIHFDRGHLHQIIWNLTANAWRHSSKGLKSVMLVLALKEDNDSLVYLDIFDDGPGVPEKFQSNIFEPFFTTESSGTGLGLYIARELAEANHARLDYCPPEGCFRLTCKVAS